MPGQVPTLDKPCLPSGVFPAGMPGAPAPTTSPRIPQLPGGGAETPSPITTTTAPEAKPTPAVSSKGGSQPKASKTGSGFPVTAVAIAAFGATSVVLGIIMVSTMKTRK
jgi:hypothetical protein